MHLAAADRMQLLLPHLQRAPAGLRHTQPTNDSRINDETSCRRKGTYATRREEARTLKAEVSRLANQLRSLKQRREGATSIERATELRLALQANARMHALTQTNHRLIMGAQASLWHMIRNDEPSINPLTSFIHLTSDAQHRRQTLLALKHQKLAMAVQYVRTKNHQRNLLKPYSEISRFEDDQGNFHCVHLDIVQLKDAKSARQAFDALMYTIANMEISVSEKLGEITVREDDELPSDGVGNYRMRTWEHPTVSQEANCATFTHFFESHPCDNGDGYGVASIDFVDQDDLFPYRPAQNMRRDLTIACTISTQRGPENDQEPVVVIQRAGFIKMHSTALVRDQAVLDQMRNGITRWCDIVLSSMREYVASAQKSPVLVNGR